MLKLTNYDAVIFDMDGVLIDSEPTWKIAMEQAFKAVGCPLTPKEFQKTTGMRIDEVVSYWYEVAPWKDASVKDVENSIVEKMVELILQEGSALEGVIDTLHFLKENKIKIGLATSSYRRLIDAVLSKLCIQNFFDVTHSAENEKFGKPHPGVYLTTAEALRCTPKRCLVIEDSLNGIISGKAATMDVVCIPEKSHLPNPKIILADYHFGSMTEFLNDLKCND
jgi:sugar-phosphatase